MKRWLQLIMVLLFGVSLSTAALAEGRNNSVPDEVMAAAEEALNLYREYVTDRPKEYGFEEPEEANLLTLGDGHQVYSLNMDKLWQESNADSLLALSDLSEEWEFIVLYDSEPRSFLSVGKNEQSGQWEALGFGGTSLYFAQQLKLFEEWTAGERTEDRPYIVRDGSSRYIVANLQGIEHSLPVHPDAGEQDTAISDRAQLIPASEAIAQLKEREGRQAAPLLLIVVGVLILAATLSLAMRKQKKKESDSVKSATPRGGQSPDSSTKQSTKQSAKQSGKPSTKHSDKQSTKQSTEHSTKEFTTTAQSALSKQLPAGKRNRKKSSKRK
ncbi:hypothetical protein [Paenibacillus senegalensis]|uniref:hypothetical protein n=1 Tax=Paenibacillus senegalensis TaxID=1465766 RepID=UPI0002886CAB|nr:hypothetical protein [Paenibacillus senegalensis]